MHYPVSLIIYYSLVCYCSDLAFLQISLSLYGTDIPTGFTVTDSTRRRKVFEIVAPYVLSEKDISTVRATPQNHVDLWLTTFTNSQKGIVGNLYNTTKFMARQFFPSSGTVPSKENAAHLGLRPGTTILDRQVLLHHDYRVAISSNMW